MNNVCPLKLTTDYTTQLTRSRITHQTRRAEGRGRERESSASSPVDVGGGAPGQAPGRRAQE